MQPQPQANRPIQTTSSTKDYQQYLAELDQLLKRNTGTGLFTAEDATSNTPMYIPGQVAQPGGIESNAAAISAQPRESVVPDFYMPDVPQDEQYSYDPQGDVLGVQSQPMTVQDFVTQFNQAVYRPQRSTTEQLEKRYQQTGQKYGVQSLADGRIRYNDGSIGLAEEAEATPIASMRDGSVLWSDGFTREAPPYGMGNQYLGTEGLSRFIFGRNQTVTQPYGNINPIEPTPGNVNYGTDFRTRDLPERNLKLPVNTKVIQILRDDGTRFGTISGHAGYGNSILLELPTGERVRLSHLANLPDFKPGETIAAGTVFGTPGATGNTYGEHLDVEYYDKTGKISNPETFLSSGATQYSAGNKITGVSPYLQRSNMSVDPRSVMNKGVVSAQREPEQSFNQQSGQMTNSSQGIQNAAQSVRGFGQNIRQLPQQAGRVLGEAIDENQALNRATNGMGAGISELLQGDIQGAGREVSNTIEKINPTPRIDTGFSELLRGDVAGAKRNFTNTAQRAASRIARLPEQISSAVVPTTYADDGSQKSLPETLGQNISGAAKDVTDYIGAKSSEAQDVVRQAGAGVKDLGQAGVDALGAVFKPKQEDQKRAVGDVAGTADGAERNQFSSVMDGAPSMSKLAKNDVSDPFFKMGGSEMYKSYLKPNAKDLFGGALNLDIFTPDFYKDLGNIASVFGGSKDIGSATERYVENEKKKYPTMSRMNWEEGYDRGEIDNYNRQVDEYNNSINNYLNSIRSSVNGSKSIFTPVQSSRQNIFAKPAVNMSMSQSTAPRMSAAPTISKPQMSMARPSSAPQMSSVSRVSAPQMSIAPRASAPSQNFTPAKANMTSAATGRPVIAPKVQSAPAPQKLAPMSYAKPYSPAPKPAPKPAPQMSKAPAPQSKPSSNVFSRVTNAIKSVFRR